MGRLICLWPQEKELCLFLRSGLEVSTICIDNLPLFSRDIDVSQHALLYCFVYLFVFLCLIVCLFEHAGLVREHSLDKQPPVESIANETTLPYNTVLTLPGYDVNVSWLQLCTVLDKYSPGRSGLSGLGPYACQHQ